jgi:hypothetical protein
MKNLLISMLLAVSAPALQASYEFSISYRVDEDFLNTLHTTSIDDITKEFRLLSPDQQHFLFPVIDQLHNLFSASITRIVAITSLAIYIESESGAMNDRDKQLLYTAKLFRSVLELLEPACYYLEDLYRTCQSELVEECTKNLFIKITSFLTEGFKQIHETEDAQELTLKILEDIEQRFQTVLYHIHEVMTPAD